MTAHPMATHYPVMLDLRGRLAVVIGGGAIAEQKVRELREAAARVRVVSPVVGPALDALARAGEIEHVPRGYRAGDLRGARVAIAATDDRQVNRAVWEEAEAAGVLLNAVDDVDHCHFIAPSVHRAGDVTVTVSTAGRCPALAVRLRERLGHLVRREHAELARVAGAWRAEVARRLPDFGTRRALWYRVVDSAAIDALRRGDAAAAHDTIERLVREAEGGEARDVPNGGASTPAAPAAPGMVSLVGAGPGDAGLITVRGLERLRAADVVVHDRLVGAELLTHASPTARLIPVGKHGHGPSATQAEIDATLIREARLGHRVVRLKGGDPFVFGRGAEEAATLRRAGVPFEVVPGISAAVAVPAAAGIPVTHRALASGFAVVTGHECTGDGETSLDWGALARMPTLVVLMGLRALPNVAARLLAHGLDPRTPAAVVASGTLPDERVVTATIATVAEAALAAGLVQPATLIVGRVVSVRDALLGAGDEVSSAASHGLTAAGRAATLKAQLKTRGDLPPIAAT